MFITSPAELQPRGSTRISPWGPRGGSGTCCQGGCSAGLLGDEGRRWLGFGCVSTCLLLQRVCSPAESCINPSPPVTPPRRAGEQPGCTGLSSLRAWPFSALVQRVTRSVTRVWGLCEVQGTDIGRDRLGLCRRMHGPV